MQALIQLPVVNKQKSIAAILVKFIREEIERVVNVSLRDHLRYAVRFIFRKVWRKKNTVFDAFPSKDHEVGKKNTRVMSKNWYQ